ncbi:thioredoxin [Buchnera aphidicola (Thelaxes californica)]|uniref:Thioredoxin n=1 Tax=Buchnera aphidicola (Thelaxes californica) TaxID=1315998 RepID=A0A4D6YAS9_9GAMM|nr:thioredoxin [Buchnera aphidicola]QCI26977.1 thioredoxin [Buchnera aphidicola (Thelaxes californica)]
MNNNNIIIVTDKNFETLVLEEKKPVLVDFWAPWCNPCKILSPILEEIAQEYIKTIVIAKINVDENPNIAPQYSIRGIPTLLFFKEGNLLGTKVGALSKLELKNFLDTHLNK